MPGPVFLVGFPGAGKSTAGAACAAMLGRGFVDLDDVESCLSLHVAVVALDALRRPAPGRR